MARVLVLVLAAVLVGCIDRSPPMEVSETAAVREIQRIQEAEKAYRIRLSRYGTLDELRAEGLLPPARTGEGYEYRLVYVGDHFHIEAWPVEYNQTGRRSFSADESLQVRQSWTPAFVPSSSKPVE